MWKKNDNQIRIINDKTCFNEELGNVYGKEMDLDRKILELDLLWSRFIGCVAKIVSKPGFCPDGSPRILTNSYSSRKMSSQMLNFSSDPLFMRQASNDTPIRSLPPRLANIKGRLRMVSFIYKTIILDKIIGTPQRILPLHVIVLLLPNFLSNEEFFPLPPFHCCFHEQLSSLLDFSHF